MKLYASIFTSALSVCAIACAAQPLAPEAERCRFKSTTRFGLVEEPLDLAKWLEPQAAQLGANPRRDLVLVSSGAGAAGDHLEGLLAVPEEDCALIMARASGSVSDLDLFAYSDEGAVLGSDEGISATPAVLVCPPHPARLFISARVAKGHGLVAVGAQHMSPSAAAKARTALGLDPSAPPLELGDERWPDLAERLAAHRELLGGEWESPSLRVLPADSRLPTHVSANATKDRCVDALLLPDPRVGHLDVAVLDLEGKVVGRAAATGRERFITVCSGRDTGFTLRVQPHSGRGTVALVLSRSLSEGASSLDVPVIHLDPAPSVPLDEQSRTLSVALEERGYAASPTWRSVVRARAFPASPLLELGPGCHRLDILGSSPVRSLEASLWSAEGLLLGTARGRVPLELATCTERVSVRLEIRPEPMPGDVAVELRPVPGPSAALRRSPLAASRLISRMLGRGVIRSIAQLTRVDPVELDATTLLQIPLTLPVARCVDATIALGAGSARGVELRLRNQRTGAQLAFARGAVSAAARACTLERPESFIVTVEARTVWGAGPALFASRLLAPKP